MAVASLLVKAVAKALPARATGVPAWPSAYPCPSAKSVVQNSSNHTLPFQHGIFEVDQNAQVQPREIAVSVHFLSFLRNSLLRNAIPFVLWLNIWDFFENSADRLRVHQPASLLQDVLGFPYSDFFRSRRSEKLGRRHPFASSQAVDAFGQ